MEFLKKLLRSAPEHKTVVDLANTTILDVRTKEEFTSGHVKGALNIDFHADSFSEQIAKLDKNKNYVLYCRSGNRSGQATLIMKQMGFPQAENLGSLQQASNKLNLPVQ